MKTLLIAALFSLPAFAAGGNATATSLCGPDNVKFKVKAGKDLAPVQAAAGKALVYVVEQFDRPGNEWGRPTIRTSMDGAWVGANRGSTHFAFAVDPGEHSLCSDWQSLPPWLRVQPSAAHLTAAPDTTYYFRARVVSHHDYFTLDLERVDDDEGKLLVKSSAPSASQPK